MEDNEHQSRQWVIGSDPRPTQKPTHDPVYMTHDPMV